MRLRAKRFSILAATLLAGTALAHGYGPGPKGRFLDRLDTNGDGKITRAEFDQAHKARIQEHFKKLDADDDGKITLAEFEKARLAWGARGFARMDRNGDGVIEPEEMHRPAAGGPGRPGCAGGHYGPGPHAGDSPKDED